MTLIKPTDTLGWIPNNTTNITDPGAKKTAGFTSLMKVSANENNWLFNRTSQWVDFLNLAYYSADTTITATTSQTTLDAACEKLKSGFIIQNNATVTINFAGSLSPTAGTIEINNVHGGKLKLTSGTNYAPGVNINIRNCTADIEIENFITIRAGGSGNRPCVNIENSRKVLFTTCTIVPVLGYLTYGMVEVDNSFVTFDACTGTNDTFSYVFKLTNNSLLKLSTATLIDDYSGDATAYIGCDSTSTFNASYNIFANIATDGTIFPLITESGHFPKLRDGSTGTDYEYDFIITTSNEADFKAQILYWNKIDGNVNIKSAGTLTETMTFNNLSGNGKITFSSNSGSYKSIVFNTADIYLDFTGTIKSIVANYCSKVSLRGTHGGLTSGATEDCIQLNYNTNAIINGTIRYWTAQAIVVGYGSKLVMGSSMTITPATNRDVVNVSGGSQCHIYETLTTGDILKISESSYTMYSNNFYVGNTTV